jgi:hypothetical protein
MMCSMSTEEAEVAPTNAGRVHLSRDGQTTLCGNAVGTTLATDAFVFLDAPSKDEDPRCGSCTRLVVAAVKRNP